MIEVEIWSDVICPFCYIGKRNFETALSVAQVEKGSIRIVWRSFQLQPDLVGQPGKNAVVHLAESKGWTLDHAKNVVENVTEMAKNVGLDYDFDQAVVANSFDAHRLSHLARKHALQNNVKERLFAAYFTEGKDIANKDILIEIGEAEGIPAPEIRGMLATDQFSGAVLADTEMARLFGIRSVPFFIFDRKLAVSGAQPVEIFVETIQKSLEIKTMNKRVL